MMLPSAWRRSLSLYLALTLGLLLLYRATGLAMIEIWDRSGTFAHAWVVPPISAWLIWRQRAELVVLTPRPAPLFLLPFGLAGALWLIGDLASVNSATQLALVAMLVLLVPVALGWSVARTLAFPLGFLFFCVPIGEFMLPQMMEWTADFTVAAVRLSGVPVYREGLQFVIPSGNWSVVEACSGIRYLIASIMVGTLFAYLNYRSLKRRLIFVGVATALPLVANWLRAYMIVMLGHLSDNRLATGVDHLVYGWVFFGIVMFALFMIGARWAEADEPAAAREVIPAGLSAATGRSYAWVLAALLIAAPILLDESLAGETAKGAPQLDVPDLSAGGWLPAQQSLAGFKPAFDLPAAELQTTYSRADGAKVGVYVAYYRAQDYESKLISSDNVLVRPDSHLWALVDQGRVESDGLNWRTGSLLASIGDGGLERSRLKAWELFWVNGHWTSSDLMAKFHGVMGRLMGQGDDAAVLVVYAQMSTDNPTSPAADEALTTFVRDNRLALEAWLSKVRTAGHAGVKNNH